MKNDMIANIAQIDERIEIYKYSNGYMVELNGKDTEDEYITQKLICNSIEDVLQLITDVDKIPVRN